MFTVLSSEIPHCAKRGNVMHKVVVHEVRQEAADTLGKVGLVDPQIVIPALIGLINNDNYFLRRAAIESLGCFGPNAHAAVPSLIRNIKLDDYSLESTIDTLGKIGVAAKDAIPIIQDVMLKYRDSITMQKNFKKALDKICNYG